MNIAEFSKVQKETYDKVHELEHELMKSVDPATFVLNPETLVIRYKIEQLQRDCDHIFEDGVCVVCGKEEDR